MTTARRTRSVLVAMTATWLALGALGGARIEAQQADFGEYDRLLEQTEMAHRAVLGAGESPSEDVLTHALESDTALIGWIEAYATSDDFGRLADDDQRVLLDSLDVAIYLRATARAALGACETARDELAALLERADLDSALRPEVASAHDEATACLSRPSVARLQIDCDPANAQVSIDGVPVGLAREAHEVEAGRHVIALSAPDRQTHEVVVDVGADQQTVALGPIELLRVAEPPLDGSSDPLWPPTWYEWTLWGAGVVFIAVGAGFWANAGSIQNEAERANGGVVDDVNQGAIDREETRAIVLWTLGLASVAVGTVLFFVLEDEPSPEAGSVSLRAGGLTFWF